MGAGRVDFVSLIYVFILGEIPSSGVSFRGYT